MHVHRYAVPIIIAVTLAGCGGGGSGGTSGTASAATGSAPASASTAASSPGAASSGSAEGSAAGGAGGAAGGEDRPVPSGTLDAGLLGSRMGTAVQAKRTVTVRGEGPEQLACGVRYGASLEESCSLTVQGRPGRFVLLRGAMYMNLGEKIKGKSWLKIDLNGSDPVSKAMAPMLTTLQQSADPKNMASRVKGLKATASAGEDVDGTPTVAYRLSMNSRQLLEAMPPAQRKLVGSMLTGVTSRTVFYVDADWLPRKVIVTTTVKGKATTQTLRYTDWGGPVTIVLPPASDVTTSVM